MKLTDISELLPLKSLKVVLFGVPALLFIPILYYSLTTPFALADDYGDWQLIGVLDSPEAFSGWLYDEFLGSDISRYRPFWEFFHVVAWKLFGPTPWLHHLSRWIFHFSSVFMFVAAFLCFSKHVEGNVERGAAGYRPLPLLPLGLLMYLWLFFPNSPASRLSPQEVHTVFFLGLCNWMAALMLSGEDSGRWTRATLLQYGLFCLGCLGLSWSKEVNVAVVLWMQVSYYAWLWWRGWMNWGKILGGVPLVFIVFFTFHRVYVASKVFGVGYGQDITKDLFINHMVAIRDGLFQADTSLWITAGLTVLSAIVLWAVVRRLVTRRLDNEFAFVLFLLGQFASLYFILSFSWGVVLRYWYGLIPIFTTLLAFSAKFILEAAEGRSRMLANAVTFTLSSFIIFFIGCNYYNFAFQTIVQHSLRNAEARLISEIYRLSAQGKYVRIEKTRDEHEHRLIHHSNFQNYFYGQNYEVHTVKPEVGQQYYFVSRNKLAVGEDGALTIANQRNYQLLTYASWIAAAFQGKQPHRSQDAGVASFDEYQWQIRALISSQPELLIRSDFEVSLDRNENSLVYVKDPCGPGDTEATFFLHVIPADLSDLPDYRKQHGSDNLDFRFNDYRISNSERCVAVRGLPAYAIVSIRTGQYTDAGHLWEAEASFFGE